MELEIESTPELAYFLAENLPPISENQWDDVRELGTYQSKDGFGSDGEAPGVVRVRLEKAMAFRGAFLVWRIIVIAGDIKWPPSGTVHLYQEDAEEEAARLISWEGEKKSCHYLCQWEKTLWDRIPAAARSLNAGRKRRFDLADYWGGFSRVYIEAQSENRPSFWPVKWCGFCAGFISYDCQGIFVMPCLGGYLASRSELSPEEMTELQAWLAQETHVLITLARQLPHEGPPDMPERANYWGTV
jgi:hypothetical protein